MINTSAYRNLIANIQKNKSKSPIKNQKSPIKTEKKILKKLEEKNKENKDNNKMLFCQNHPKKKAKFINYQPKQQLCDQCAHEQLQLQESKLQFTNRTKFENNSINMSLNSFEFTEIENNDDVFQKQQQLIENNFDYLIQQLQIQKQQALDENKRNFKNISKNWTNLGFK